METTPAIIDSTSLVVPEKFNIENQEVNKELLRARIAEDTFKPLCTDINDTKGYKALVAKRAEYRTLRTSLEKHRKDAVKPLQTYISQLKDATDELGSIAFEGEQFFDDAIKSIDAEKARIKREEEERKAQALQARIADINALGAIYHDGTYTLPYDESKSVTATQIATLSDTGFEELLDEMKEAFADNETKLHEERLKEEAEAERRIQIVRDNEALANSLLEQRSKLRIKELLMMGGQDNGNEITFTNSTPNDSELVVNISRITKHEDDQWEQLVAKVHGYMNPVGKPESVQVSQQETKYKEWLDIGNAVSAALGNPVDMPDESYMANHRVEAKEKELIDVVFFFSKMDGYVDFERSAKETIRLYPDKFAEIAISGCKVVKQGKIQGLNIAVIKK
jgi:hypothetical protein